MFAFETFPVDPYMLQPKSDIIRRLQHEILPLQGYKSALGRSSLKIDLDAINPAFPNATFPLGAIHEFMVNAPGTKAATSGFVTSIISSLMKEEGVVLWISANRTIFPPALSFFNIDAHRIIFVDLRNQKEVSWAVEEALQVKGLAAVVGEVQELDFTASRRLQLAVEKSQVTGFILNNNKKNNTNASLCRWQVQVAPSIPIDNLPGIGYPCWKVDLLKVRNGCPGSWQIAWMNGRFSTTTNKRIVYKEFHKKTG
ncbi:ImuA family protein [Niastella sp. OAS944]|uniref:ImuA family protein n=1 Tax=Niastella sp. OAS944 TaxID=2664089 RepID=UPI00347FF2DF|nr:protein ImuA [Chitinophagaceae bacterium OAS944]